MIEIKAKMVFDPPNVTRKHINQKDWKYTAMLLLDDDTDAYYRWFIEKRYNLKLNQPLRGSHITFINDRISDGNSDILENTAKYFDGKLATFQYDPNDIRTNDKHWWIKVQSEDLLNIRTVCGFNRVPYFGLHLTIGLANEKYIEHSKYIHRCIKTFEL